MALNIISTQFMLHAKRVGVDFTRTTLLGRQQMNLSAEHLLQNLEKFKFEATYDDAQKIASERYAESFFRFVGAREVVSFDASQFESATVVHDFNEPVPEEFHGAFDAVIDVGSLEHIFNFPMAILNLMRMVDLGGTFLGVMPMNNMPGHGFYQFSPELLYRVLSEANGFRVEEMIVAQQDDLPPFPCMSWEPTDDPAVVGHRVEMRTPLQTCLMVRAKKVGSTPSYLINIQQSDYALAWASK